MSKSPKGGYVMMEKGSNGKISGKITAHGHNRERYRYDTVNCWLENLKPKAHMEKR